MQLFTVRYHYGSYDVHHHNWSQCLYATCVLHQSSGHLPVGQLCVRVSFCYRVCSGQLLDHCAGAHREETQRASECTHSIIHNLWHKKESFKPAIFMHVWYIRFLMTDSPLAKEICTYRNDKPDSMLSSVLVKPNSSYWLICLWIKLQSFNTKVPL